MAKQTNEGTYVAAALAVLRAVGRAMHYAELGRAMVANGFINPTGGDAVATGNNAYAYCKRIADTASLLGVQAPVTFHGAGMFSATSDGQTDEQARAEQPKRSLTQTQQRLEVVTADAATLRKELADLKAQFAAQAKAGAGAGVPPQAQAKK